jgi:3-oxoacyl-[acyl-carrier protein] reductase
MARAAAPRLREQGWGRIIGVTTSFDTMLRATPYGPAKAGHEALVVVMARELEGTGVTANVLVPGGATYTNMTAGDGPRPGMLQPEVMQAPVVWLASDASDGFTGHRIIGKFWDESLPIEQRLAKAERIDWSRAIVDASLVDAKRGARRSHARSAAAPPAASI